MKNLLSFLGCALLAFAVSAQSANDTFKPLKYRNIGPFRGGRSVCASGVVGDPLTYYFGTTGGGVWKTEDAGQRWTNISDGYFKTGSVGAVAVSESDPNVVYVGMGEHAPRGVMTSYGDGVYKSYDAGKTWKSMGLEKTQHIARVIIHPKNPDIVWVAAQGALHGSTKERGIYKSTDGGKTWKNVLYVNDMTGCSELSIDYSNPQVLYAAMWHHQRTPWQVISGGPGSGLYKSTDGGETWSPLTEGLPKEMGKMAIQVSRANPNKVYALIESDSEKDLGGLFASNDGGDSWKMVSGDNRLVQRAWYYIEVFPDPVDENTVYVLSAPALRSIDGGRTWERLSGTHGDYHDLWINPDNPKNMIIANDGGGAISHDFGASWSTQQNMPTAQFYRVNVDNLFPYNIYGGQQDNTSVRIASRALARRSITTQDWTYSAGGESAFLAFDPDNPRYVLGGSYLGTIEILDMEAKAGTKIMAAPIQYLGREARDMKYLFNWNAPIIKSQHEPDTYYHAAQVLLRTRDKGITWEEASPDLTNNDDAKQGKGGAPYTNEAVGAENYGTIAYVKESPHEAGVIWTGSDDGLVQITRDNGETWTNVTPKGLGECLVNAIDVSPHDPATAYIATTRYKFNDHTPSLWKTTNYGKSWTNISAGIPYGAYTRVVIEDDVRKDLLFAGTETGMYISWNGGQQWEPFQLNLPVVPITDLIIRHGNLVVATMGRSFWVLDDLSLLRQHNSSDNAFALYNPGDAVIGNWGSPLNGNSPDFDGTNPFDGVNPANGVVVYYSLPEIADSVHIEMTILDAAAQQVTSFSSQSDPEFKRYAGGPPASPTLAKSIGMNRFVWDIRYPIMPGAPTAYIEGSFRGHKASPGDYKVVLKMGDQELEGQFKILPNPRYDTTPEQYEKYHQFMMSAENSLTEMHNTVNELMDMRKQVEAIVKKMKDDPSREELMEEGRRLIKEMKAWDSEMIQRKSQAYDDVENFENKFTANYLFMINATDSGLPRVNQSSLDRKAELDQQWEALNNRARSLMETDVPAYNKQLWDAGVGAIHTGKKTGT